MRRAMSEDKLIKEYEYKIEIILENRLEYNGNHEKDIQAIRVWLCCEWQCGELSLSAYAFLIEQIKVIADKIIRNL